jgi:hypothetical protein
MKRPPGRDWVNAHSKGIAVNPAYTQHFRIRPCLIPVSRLYE